MILVWWIIIKTARSVIDNMWAIWVNVLNVSSGAVGSYCRCNCKDQYLFLKNKQAVGEQLLVGESIEV